MKPRSDKARGDTARHIMAARIVERSAFFGLKTVIRAYQYLLRPLIGANCRYQPHCSAYAVEALDRHGAWHGSLLAVRRIMRCHPWAKGGADPVPPCCSNDTHSAYLGRLNG